MPRLATAPPRRDQALAYIIECIVRSGTSPTNDEIGRQLGVSKARAQQLVDELIRRGTVSRTPGAQRNLQVRDVQQCRMVIDERLRALGWIAADPLGELRPYSQEQLPILPPFEHLPSDS